MAVDKETLARIERARDQAKEVIAVRRRNPRQALKPLSQSVADELPRLSGQSSGVDVSGMSATNPFTGGRLGRGKPSIAEAVGFKRE